MVAQTKTKQGLKNEKQLTIEDLEDLESFFESVRTVVRLPVVFSISSVEARGWLVPMHSIPAL